MFKTSDVILVVNYRIVNINTLRSEPVIFTNYILYSLIYKQVYKNTHSVVFF